MRGALPPIEWPYQFQCQSRRELASTALRQNNLPKELILMRCSISNSISCRTTFHYRLLPRASHTFIVGIKGKHRVSAIMAVFFTGYCTIHLLHITLTQLSHGSNNFIENVKTFIFSPLISFFSDDITGADVVPLKWIIYLAARLAG